MSQQDIDNEKRQQERDTASRSRGRHDQQQQYYGAKTKQTATIISLSKLKSYMPQNNVTSKLFPCLAKASIAKPIATVASSVPCYRRRGDLPDSSTCKLDKIYR